MRSTTFLQRRLLYTSHRHATRRMRCVSNPPGPCRDFESGFRGSFAPAQAVRNNTPGFKYFAECSSAAAVALQMLFDYPTAVPIVGVAIPASGITTNKQRGDNVMSMPVNILDRRTVQIGFIGLGLMGSRLTRRLHSAGWNVQAWNRTPGSADVLRREGVVIAKSVAAPSRRSYRAFCIGRRAPTALASSIWRSPGQRRRSRRERLHCSPVVIRRPSSNALPSTSPSRSSGS
jgi:hypothetical protein